MRPPPGCQGIRDGPRGALYGPSVPASSPSGEHTTVARRAGTVVLFTLLSRVAGYVRDSVFGHVFGAGAVYDGFLYALTIPNVLRRLVAEGSLLIAFVPVLTEERKAGGTEAMRRFTSATLGLLIPVLLVLCGLGVALPEVWVTLFASQLDPERRAIAVHLTGIMMPYIVFISLTAVASGILNTRGVFGPPAAAPIALNAVLIVAALFLTGFFALPIEAVAWAFVVGGVLQLLLQVPWVAQNGLLVRPRWELENPGLRRLLARMGPAVLGVAAYQLNVLVIRQIASALPEGQLSCYHFASRLEEFALGVFAVSVSIAALPTLSEHAANQDRARLVGTFRRAVTATNFITVPSAVALGLFAEPMVGVLFRHGQFDASAGRLTADLLQMMAFALPAIGLVRVLVPTYYALGDTKTPVVASVASLVTTTVVGLVTMRAYEIRGLTLATIAAAGVQAVLLAGWLGRRLDRRFPSEELTSEVSIASDVSEERLDSGARGWIGPATAHLMRVVVAVAPGALLGAAWAPSVEWLAGDNLRRAFDLGILLGGFGASYLVVGHLFGISEVRLVVEMARRRLRRAR